MEFENSRKYQKLTKTDKYPWCKKEKNVNTQKDAKRKKM